MKQETIHYHDMMHNANEAYIEMRQAVTVAGRYAYKFDIIRGGNVIADLLDIDDLIELRDAMDNAIRTYHLLARDIEIPSDSEPDGEEG